MFDQIRPYNDSEAVAALKRVSASSMVDSISDFIFPGKDPQVLRDMLCSITGVDDFQRRVVSKGIESILEQTSDGLTYGGLENYTSSNGEIIPSLLISNHRDIILDSAFIQILLFWNNLPFSEIAAGDNLMDNRVVEDIIRSNRTIKVIRSENPREVYTTSKDLSEYIRDRIKRGGTSVWLAHRNGRTKDGFDLTEQGLLKMLDMSGEGSFVENFKDLSLMPVAISYEYEPCDLFKALELYHRRRDGFYKKQKREDINSMISGVTQQKGRVHIEFCKPISEDELLEAKVFDKNERFRHLAHIVDERIVAAYKIWPTNLIAASIVKGETIGDFSEDQRVSFTSYIDSKIASLEGSEDINDIRKILLEIYSAPVLRKIK